MAQTVRNLFAKQETQVQSLGWEDALEKGITTHPIILAWKISWTEKPGRLLSMGSQKSWTWIPSNVFLLSCHCDGCLSCVCAKLLSCDWLFVMLWAVTHQASLSMRFSRQEYYRALPFPSPGYCPDPGIEPVSPARVSCIVGKFFTTEPPEKPILYIAVYICQSKSMYTFLYQKI